MLLRTFLQIALLRANPQELPTSTVLLVVTLIAHVGADVWSMQDTLSLFPALQAAVIDTLLLVAVAHTALLLRNLAIRARQTLSALAGCGALISMVTWGVVRVAELLFFSGHMPSDDGANLKQGLTILFISLPFLIWYLVVFGHVMRHAMSVPLFAGVALGILYLILSIGISGAVMAVPEVPGV